MDIVQDWAAHILGDHVALQTYGPYAMQVYGYISLFKSYVFSLVDQVSRKPDLATIALLLIIVLVSLKILDMLYQTMLFWLRLGRRILFWGGLIMLAMWMYTRGPDGVMEDVQYWVQVWSQEHDYWREQERVASRVRQGKAMPGGGRTGWL